MISAAALLFFVVFNSGKTNSIINAVGTILFQRRILDGVQI